MNRHQISRHVFCTKGLGAPVAKAFRVIVLLDLNRYVLITSGRRVKTGKTNMFCPLFKFLIGERCKTCQFPTGHALQPLAITIGNGVARPFKQTDQFKQRARLQILLRHH